MILRCFEAGRLIVVCLKIGVDELDKAVEVFGCNLSPPNRESGSSENKCLNDIVGNGHDGNDVIDVESERGRGDLQFHFADRSSRRSDLGFRRRVLPTLPYPCMRLQLEGRAGGIQGRVYRRDRAGKVLMLIYAFKNGGKAVRAELAQAYIFRILLAPCPNLHCPPKMARQIHCATLIRFL